MKKFTQWVIGCGAFLLLGSLFSVDEQVDRNDCKEKFEQVMTNDNLRD